METSQTDTPRVISSLSDIVNVVMSYPLTIMMTDKSVAFRCGKQGCDLELVRYKRGAHMVMNNLSTKIMTHMTTCLANRRVYPG